MRNENNDRSSSIPLGDGDRDIRVTASVPGQILSRPGAIFSCFYWGARGGSGSPGAQQPAGVPDALCVLRAAVPAHMRRGAHNSPPSGRLSGAGRGTAAAAARCCGDDCNDNEAGKDDTAAAKPTFHTGGRVDASDPQGVSGSAKPGGVDPGPTAHAEASGHFHDRFIALSHRGLLRNRR